MIELSIYDEYNYNKKCFLNINEISSIEPYTYHSFRPTISKVSMKNGTNFVVWELPETIHEKIKNDKT